MSIFKRRLDYVFPDLTDLHEETWAGGSGPSIRMKEFWSDLDKLRWLARWVEVQAGWPQGTLQVVKGGSYLHDKPIDDAYSLNYPGGCLVGPNYLGMWDYLSGIELGARIAARLAQPPTDGPTITITAHEETDDE